MADSNSKTPLALSVASCFVCCAPVGLIGAGLGLRQGLAAREKGQPFGGANLGAVILGLASIGMSTGLYMSYKQDQAELGDLRARAAAAVEALDRSAEQLSAEAACVLATDHILQNERSTPTRVSCPQPVQQTGTVATLSGVLREGSAEPTTVCLARVNRWFVSATLESGACPATLPELPPGPDQAATEDAIRAAMPNHMAQLELDGLNAKLAAVRTALAGEIPEACAEVKPGDALLLDEARMSAEAAVDAGWGFLNTVSLRDALNPALELPERAKSARTAMGAAPYVIVLRAEERGLPKAAGEEWDMGYFEGWIALAELDSGKVLCAQPFSFESSETVSTGGGVDVGMKVGPKVNVGGTDLDEAISKDFLERYSAAIRTGATALSADKVKVVF